MDPSHIRNFCIIAHIDHGKSTLADRLMQTTGAVSDRELTAQHLDSMDLERERGITIKAQAVRLAHKAPDGTDYQLNLIDTPGHVDFTYEVSRSLAASDGALLVVDSTQGIQAQTLANIYLAMEYDLPIIPVVNKIDLPAAEPERVASEMASAFGFTDDEFVFVSAKTGEGIVEILDAIVEKVPPPSGDESAPLRALIFDSKYDSYKGVVAYVRAIDGRLDKGGDIRLMATGATAEVLEIGFFGPTLTSTNSLETGEVGYVATGLKDVDACRVGDTMTIGGISSAEALPGYEPMKAMVYTGLYPADGESFPELRDALEKLRLNDPALSFEPESSAALGFGFRCGFLGLLHMDVTQERLEREYDLTLIATAPSVGYSVYMTSGDEIHVDNPSAMPSVQEIDKIYEPWVDLNIVAPSRFIGTVMELVTTRRGEYTRMEYLQSVDSGREDTDTSAAADARVLLEYKMPLAELLVDFHSQLKSRSQGYASMDYSIGESRPGDMVKLDVLVNYTPVDALSMMLHRDNAESQGRELVAKLKKLIPRQMFEVPIQSAIGSRVIARETVKAMRKNVLAKCYGGDVSRKKKLLQKQAKGKKRMKKIGSVDVPQEAFMAVLSLERE
ncbi:MAG: elongation factor 4 [Chloroflexi bacterium]|jgi:GTP-binding protein LepA|nr:elongation factor 4 [Chloroflexota bacterium]MBT4514858.1 elongation factor 4 [Chloroflexota bacterium]MBT6680673.1 elongation factor 4 [Chloroflexota bacterium]